MSLVPPSREEARTLLERLGALPRLLRHVDLVGEAAEMLLAAMHRLNVEVDANMVRVGVVLHDAGKILHPAELDRHGSEHQLAGQRLLLDHGVSPALARICVSHARWTGPDMSLEELLVGLADTLWKGKRCDAFEARVIAEVAAKLRTNEWTVHLDLDTCFEEIAASCDDRLARSGT